MYKVELQIELQEYHSPYKISQNYEIKNARNETRFINLCFIQLKEMIKK
jgi:hypothetical protein